MKYLLAFLLTFSHFSILQAGLFPKEFIHTVIPQPKREPRLLLITGCARSGTAYIADFLKLNGLKIEHERDAPDGTVAWQMAVDSDGGAWCPGANHYTYKHTFHQVRDPLKTIASASHEPDKAWLYTCKYVPQIKMEDPPLVRAAKYWYYWNLQAEKKSEWTYRIENLENELPKMSKRLKFKLDKNLLEKVPKNTNHRGQTQVPTWKELKAILDPSLYKKIVRMAKRYGYTVRDAQ